MIRKACICHRPLIHIGLVWGHLDVMILTFLIGNRHLVSMDSTSTLGHHRAHLPLFLRIEGSTSSQISRHSIVVMYGVAVLPGSWLSTSLRLALVLKGYKKGLDSALSTGNNSRITIV
jgi:hypothetical protein